MNDTEWRRLSGAGDHTPPDMEPLSRSEGDLNRNAYRPSRYPRLAQRAVSNDDGTAIAERTEALLAQVSEQLDALRIELKPFETVTVDGITRVGNKAVRIGPTPVPGVGAAVLYTANDAFGILHRVQVPKSGIIQSVRFYDKDDEGLNMELLLFRELPGAQTDNAAIAVADIDLPLIEASILIDTWRDLLDNQVGIEDALDIAYTAPNGELWAQWVSRGGPTIAAAAMPEWGMTILADE